MACTPKVSLPPQPPAQTTIAFPADLGPPSPIASAVESLSAYETVHVQTRGEWVLGTVRGPTGAPGVNTPNVGQHWLASTQGDAPVLLAGQPNPAVTLAASGDVVGTQPHPTDGTTVLTIWGPDGQVKSERPYPSTQRLLPGFRSDISDAGDRILVVHSGTRSAEGTVELLDETLTTLWTTVLPQMVINESALAPNASSALVFGTVERAKTAILIDGETGTLHEQLPPSTEHTQMLTTAAGWVEGNWLLTHHPRRTGDTVSPSQWSLAAPIEQCLQTSTYSTVFADGAQTLLADPQGNISRWQGCGLQPTPVATLEQPASAVTDDWLSGVFMVGEHPWVSVDKQRDLLSLNSDYTWQSDPSIRRDCHSAELGDEPSTFACVGQNRIEMRQEAWVQFHHADGTHSEVIRWFPPQRMRTQSISRVFLPDQQALLLTPIDEGPSVLVTSNPPEIVQLATTHRIDQTAEGTLETVVDGVLSEWRNGEFSPTGDWRACDGQVQQWLRDDGTPTVLCQDGQVHSYPPGRTPPTPYPAGRSAGGRALDLPGPGHFLLHSGYNTRPKAVEDGVVRDALPGEMHAAFATVGGLTRRVIRGQSAPQTDLQTFHIGSDGGIAAQNPTELGRSPSRDWVVRRTATGWLAVYEPLVFERSFAPHIHWDTSEPSQREPPDLDRYLPPCLVWDDDLVSLAGRHVTLTNDQGIGQLVIEGASESLQACVYDAIDFSYGDVHFEGTLELE